MTHTPELSREILEAALRGLTHEKTKIEEQMREIEGILRPSGSAAKKSAGPEPEPSRGSAKKKKRTMSVEARRRIAEAQRRRWAASKGETANEPKQAPAASKKATRKGAKGKRVMSPEVRARMAEAQRKRWAAKRS